MDTIAFLREQLVQARAFAQGTLADLPEADAHAAPPGRLNPVAATYAHVVTGEDGFVNGLIRGGAPLFASAWAGRTGLSELPPPGPDWFDWGRRVRVELPALHEYAAAVAGATDAYIASLTPADLERPVDLSSFGFGERTLGWVLGAGVLAHILSHWGEVAALSGLRGRTGFPR